MSPLRRLAPLSLSLLLVASVGHAAVPLKQLSAAQHYNLAKSVGKAAPAPLKGQGLFRSLGNAFKGGVAEYKAQRVAAGPGLIKRTIMSIGNKWDGLKAAGSELKAKVADLPRATRLGFIGWRANRAEAHAQQALNKAARLDIARFANEKGNADVRAALKNDSKAAGLGALRFERAMNVTASYANGALMGLPGNVLAPLNGAGVLIAAHSIHTLTKNIAKAQVDVHTQLANRFSDRIPAERLAKWSQGGAIRTSNAE